MIRQASFCFRRTGGAVCAGAAASLLSWGGTDKVAAQTVTSGDDDIVLNTSATGNNILTLSGGNDTLTISAGVTLTGVGGGGNGFVIGSNNLTGLTVNNAGVVQQTNNGNASDGFVLQGIAGPLMINNTGSILQAGGASPNNPNGIAAAIQLSVGDNLTFFSITNSGTIASVKQAIQFNGDAQSSIVLNQAGGLIQATSGRDSGGINTALFLSSGADTVTNESGATIDGLINLIGGDDRFTNAGTVLDATELNLGAGDDIFVNDGSITGNVLPGADNDMITNRGTITGLSEASALGVVTLDGGADVFSNEATGTITAVSGQDGVVVTGTAADLLVNAGSITGDIGLRVTSGAVTGGIENRGTITGLAGTAIELSGLTEVTPIVLNGGRIVGDVVDDGLVAGRSPVTVTGSGFVTEGDFRVSSLGIDAGRDFTVGAGDTVTVGALSASGGTLRFALGAASEGFLEVTGAGNGIDLTGVTVAATVDIDRPLNVGDEIRVGTGNAALVGQSGTTGQALTRIDDDSLLFDFLAADGGQAGITSSADATDLFFRVAQAGTASENALTSNTRAVGAVVDALAGAADPALTGLLIEVATASTADELEAVLQATLPQVDRSGLLATELLTNNTVRLVSDRLTSVRTSRRASAAGGFDPGEVRPDDHLLLLSIATEEELSFAPNSLFGVYGLQPWGQVFGQDIDQDRSDAIAGFDARTYGLTVGVDTGGADPPAVLGVAVTYADSDVRSRGVNDTQTDIDSINLTLYGDYDLSDTSYLAGDVGVTQSFHDATRFDVGGSAGLNADSDFESQQFQARLIVAKELHLDRSRGLVLTPKLTSRYLHFRTEDFTETGAGGAGLRVDNDGVDVLELGVGLDLRRKFVLNDGSVLYPEISAGYRYDVIGDAVQTSSTFIGGGPTFVSQGADPDQGTLNLGVGVGYRATNELEVSFTYDYELRGDLESHAAQLRVSVPF